MLSIPGISIPSISTYNVRSEVQITVFSLIYVYFRYLSMRIIPVQPPPDC
ncbi:hypothetical protein BDZ91DRAFT_724159 [Kalaharituber pfeilii]|nr:hypothetical protein BDZ91DRAFT_724159 [Kalaharituber pfeilii]